MFVVVVRVFLFLSCVVLWSIRGHRYSDELDSAKTEENLKRCENFSLFFCLPFYSFVRSMCYI